MRLCLATANPSGAGSLGVVDGQTWLDLAPALAASLWSSARYRVLAAPTY
jgi:hypothetical protein